MKVDVRLNCSDSCGLVSGASVARDAVVVGTWVVGTGVVGNGVVSTSVKLVIGAVGARDVFTTAVVGGTVVLTTGVVGVAVVLTMGVVEGAVVLTIGVVDKDGVVVDSVEVVLLCVRGPDVTLTAFWADVNTFMGADVPLGTMCVVDRFTGSDVALTTMFVVDLFEGAEVAFMTVYGVDIGGSGVEVVVVAEVETTLVATIEVVFSGREIEELLLEMFSIKVSTTALDSGTELSLLNISLASTTTEP